MFETLVVAPSPARSRLAGPAAALGHGLVVAGALLAAYWAPEELLTPPPPPLVCPGPVIRVDTGPPSGGGTRGTGPRTTPRRARPEASARTTSKEALANLPGTILTPPQEEPPTEPGEELPANGGTGRGDRDGPGRCPTCPPGPEDGGQAVALEAPDLLAPVLVLRVEPVYPEAMRRLHEEGVVVVDAIIGRDGSIEGASALTATNSLFEAEALRAVKLWRYEPGSLYGRKVRVRLRVSVTFRLR